MTWPAHTAALLWAAALGWPPNPAPYSSAQSGSSSLQNAEAYLQAGHADDALATLRNAAQDAVAHNLTCRVDFSLEHWDDAISECQAAVRMDAKNARYHLWLGRAYGEKASHASAFSAFSLAKQTRSEFEIASGLDGRDGEILADLGEFYEEAPGIVGGGLDKAENVAQKLDSVDQVRAHELRAHIAEKRGDKASAEQEFKQAIAISPHAAFQWMNLGSYYRRQSRFDDMVNAVRTGNGIAQKDRTQGVAWFNGAGVLIRSGREQQLAAQMLESYLAAPHKTEEAPAFVAYTKLAKLRQKLGDVGAAGHNLEAARNLAGGYKPAQQSLQ